MKPGQRLAAPPTGCIIPPDVPCWCAGNPVLGRFVESYIPVQVGPEDHVICALSGGVDSAVAALLVHKVLKERLHCVFVDNGLLRYKVMTPCLSADLGRESSGIPGVWSLVGQQPNLACSEGISSWSLWSALSDLQHGGGIAGRKADCMSATA